MLYRHFLRVHVRFSHTTALMTSTTEVCLRSRPHSPPSAPPPIPHSLPVPPEKLELELARVTSISTSDEEPFSENSASGGGGARWSGVDGRSGMCSTGGAAASSSPPGGGGGRGGGGGSADRWAAAQALSPSPEPSIGMEMVMPGVATDVTGTDTGTKLPAVCQHTHDTYFSRDRYEQLPHWTWGNLPTRFSSLRQKRRGTAPPFFSAC